jgi:hypothetical protein
MIVTCIATMTAPPFPPMVRDVPLFQMGGGVLYSQRLVECGTAWRGTVGFGIQWWTSSINMAGLGNVRYGLARYSILK